MTVLPREGERPRHISQQFQDLRHMIVVLIIFSRRLRVKQVISSQQLKELPQLHQLSHQTGKLMATHQARCGPDVDTRIPPRSEENFWTSILSRLNIVCEMMVHPTCVAEIGNLDRYPLQADGVVWEGGRQGVRIVFTWRSTARIIRFRVIMCLLLLEVVDVCGRWRVAGLGRGGRHGCIGFAGFRWLDVTLGR